MITKGALLTACATAVFFAAPASAQTQRLFGGRQQPSIMRTQSGRQVEVVRVQPRSAPTHSVGQETVEPLGLEPQPEADYEANDGPWGNDSNCDTSGGCAVGGCAAGGCNLDGCADGCNSGSCSGGCDGCGFEVCCCPPPFWAHRSFVFGEYLYLRPLDAEMAYAFQQNGVGSTGTVPAGRVGVVDQGFNPAFRTGFGKALSDCASVTASFARYQSTGSDSVTAGSGLGDTVASLVLHPNSTNAGSTSSLIEADYSLDFQLIDVGYRRILHGGPRGAVNYVLGASYGKLQQDFRSLGNFAPPSGTIRNTTHITFEGVGLRAGLDGEFQLGCTRLSGYGKGFINVLFGDFRTSYNQVDTLTTIVQANSNWQDGRAVPVLEYEVGVQWTSYNNHWRFATGYYTAFWFNSVTTSDYVQAVQNADFVDVAGTVSFNGLVSRVEYRF